MLLFTTFKYVLVTLKQATIVFFSTPDTTAQIGSCTHIKTKEIIQKHVYDRIFTQTY